MKRLPFRTMFSSSLLTAIGLGIPTVIGVTNTAIESSPLQQEARSKIIPLFSCFLPYKPKDRGSFMVNKILFLFQFLYTIQGFYNPS